MDYVPAYASEMMIRNFVNPPLSYDDVPQAELLAKIEAVESYVTTVYETGDKVACCLLVLAKLIQNPSLAKTYGPLTSENFRGDYSYTLKTGSGTKTSYEIAKSWEEMAFDILRAKSFTKDNKCKIYIVND